MQVAPDSRYHGTYPYLERTISGFAFQGTGFYLDPRSCLLVVPVDPVDQPWRSKGSWTRETLFDVYIWNCSFAQTIFGGQIVPTRYDGR